MYTYVVISQETNSGTLAIHKVEKLRYIIYESLFKNETSEL